MPVNIRYSFTLLPANVNSHIVVPFRWWEGLGERGTCYGFAEFDKLTKIQLPSPWFLTGQNSLLLMLYFRNTI